ncbi:MAG: alpha/beta hydrolase [Alphaproteobacteria bacterium]|nr:alpha/beta hydrolase [Alphaproteobacteria bacterium]MBU1514212.1 alpha/beta hydrolase [Alphaproteobacteria bacterium]MBU2095888.1 alpha/beta hydrolase [Alphaproteobacteria bacterium]MBU2151628.1 alpha/beta hydrolase [Alphaproteobacteria bacterium]MBU2307124.1 alpha/beta hydrolase [Alphaproteobacteria bacterium]
MNAMVEFEPRARRVALPTRGGEMAVLDFGPADRPVDVVFSHANGFNARTYRTILAPLGGSLRILAVDMRGHGASSLPAVAEGREGWHEFRDDLLALVAAETDGPVVLAGHSMGGTSSLLAAAAQPARVKALALFDPVIFAPTQQATEMTDNPLADGATRRRAVFPSKVAAVEAYTGRGAFRTWTPAQLADYVEAGFRETENGEVTLTCTPAWEASNFRTHHYDPWSAFRAARCPIRILRAEIGSTARLDDGQAELEATGRVRIDVIPGTSHFLPMERPDLVRDVLSEMAR